MWQGWRRGRRVLAGCGVGYGACALAMARCGAHLGAWGQLANGGGGGGASTRPFTSSACGVGAACVGDGASGVRAGERCSGWRLPPSREGRSLSLSACCTPGSPSFGPRARVVECCGMGCVMSWAVYTGLGQRARLWRRQLLRLNAKREESDSPQLGFSRCMDMRPRCCQPGAAEAQRGTPD